MSTALELVRKAEADLQAGLSALGEAVVELEHAPPPPPPPPPGGFTVGLNGLSSYGPQQQAVIERTTGIVRDRMNWPSEASWINTVVSTTNCKDPLIILALAKGESVAQKASECAAFMKTHGLTKCELGNEEYFHGMKPAEYAADYAAALPAFQAAGITLIADAWGDYQTASGGWSQESAGAGWCVDFVAALGKVPEAWSIHVYRAMAGNADFGASGEGWLSLQKFLAYLHAKNIAVPTFITEAGQPTWVGSDGVPAVSEAEQAADLKQMIRQSKEWGAAGIYLFGAMDPGPTGEGGYGEYHHDLTPKLSAAAVGEEVRALGLAS